MARKKNKSVKLEAADVASVLRAASRELHKGMKPGGFHSTRKGAKGYTRKTKHKETF
jgi:hypothetical protein